MSAPEVGAVVVGAGIAGLAAALTLQESRGEVFVIDASDRPGGVMRTDHVSRYVIERGPNTFDVKAPMLGALRELGFESALRRVRTNKCSPAEHFQMFSLSLLSALLCPGRPLPPYLCRYLRFQRFVDPYSRQNKRVSIMSTTST